MMICLVLATVALGAAVFVLCGGRWHCASVGGTEALKLLLGAVFKQALLGWGSHPQDGHGALYEAIGQQIELF